LYIVFSRLTINLIKKGTFLKNCILHFYFFISVLSFNTSQAMHYSMVVENKTNYIVAISFLQSREGFEGYHVKKKREIRVNPHNTFHIDQEMAKRIFLVEITDKNKNFYFKDKKILSQAEDNLIIEENKKNITKNKAQRFYFIFGNWKK